MFAGFLGAAGGLWHFLNTGEATALLLVFAALSAGGFGTKLIEKSFDIKTSLNAYRTYLNENPVKFPDLGPVPLLRK